MFGPPKLSATHFEIDVGTVNIYQPGRAERVGVGICLAEAAPIPGDPPTLVEHWVLFSTFVAPNEDDPEGSVMKLVASPERWATAEQFRAAMQAYVEDPANGLNAGATRYLRLMREDFEGIPASL